jgi:hypothetical protein
MNLLTSSSRENAIKGYKAPGREKKINLLKASQHGIDVYLIIHLTFHMLYVYIELPKRIPKESVALAPALEQGRGRCHRSGGRERSRRSGG